MVWLSDGEKKFEDIFIRFDATHERDGQTDRHRMPAIAALMHSIARQKSDSYRLFRNFAHKDLTTVKKNLRGLRF